MRNRKRLGVLALCAFAGGTASFIASQQAAAAEPGSVTVSYRDLQLSQPADAHILYTRLQRAAESVCVAPSRYELARYTAYERCVHVVIKDAVARINAPELDRTVAEMTRAGGEYSWIVQARQ